MEGALKNYEDCLYKVLIQLHPGALMKFSWWLDLNFLFYKLVDKYQRRYDCNIRLHDYIRMIDLLTAEVLNFLTIEKKNSYRILSYKKNVIKDKMTGPVDILFRIL